MDCGIREAAAPVSSRNSLITSSEHLNRIVIARYLASQSSAAMIFVLYLYHSDAAALLQHSAVSTLIHVEVTHSHGLCSVIMAPTNSRADAHPVPVHAMPLLDCLYVFHAL